MIVKKFTKKCSHPCKQLRSTWWGWKYPDTIVHCSAEHTVLHLHHSWQSWGWNYPPPTKARHHQLSQSYSEFLNYPLQNFKTVLPKWKYPGDFFSSYYQRRASSTATLRLHLSLFQTDNIWWGGLQLLSNALPSRRFVTQYLVNTILCKFTLGCVNKTMIAVITSTTVWNIVFWAASWKRGGPRRKHPYFFPLLSPLTLPFYPSTLEGPVTMLT